MSVGCATAEGIARFEEKLDALNKITVTLLAQNEGSHVVTMSKVCRIMAETFDISGVSVWLHVLGGPCGDMARMSQGFRWTGEHGGTDEPQEHFLQLPYDSAMPGLEGLLASGEEINGPVSSLPESILFDSLGCVSLYITPIFFDNGYWGFAIFADDRRERVFSRSEADILRSAGYLLAASLRRHERTQRLLKEEADKFREMELALLEAEKMTLAVTDASPIAYIQYDQYHNPLDCNAEALRLFGSPNKQLFLNYYWDRLMPEFQPDGQNSVERLTRLSEASEVGSRMSFEWYYMTFGGEMFPSETSLTKIEYRGSIYIVAFIYDLCRTKKMEQSIMQLESEVSKIYFDPLTGLYNRRFLDENLRRVIKRLSRSDGVLSIMMVDIDHFKPYNDTNGHIAGDSCLKAIAEALRNTVARDGDFVARYGGEEFVVVLPKTDESGARNVAERMLENVRALALPHKSSSAADYVTISIGAMTCDVKYFHTVNAYVQRADEIMYKSKRAGRNRYTFETME